MGEVRIVPAGPAAARAASPAFVPPARTVVLAALGAVGVGGGEGGGGGLSPKHMGAILESSRGR